MIRIFLIGYMGAGKTTLGKVYAQTHGLSFVDLDWYIEERYHKTVSELFAEQGEAEFRNIERKLLQEVAQFEDVVISTGGGTPCFFDNMEFMNQSGQTVFLDVRPAVLFDRLKVASASRPILQGKTDEELRLFIEEKLHERRCFYEKATYIFNADKLDSRHQIGAAVASLHTYLNKYDYTDSISYSH